MPQGGSVHSGYSGGGQGASTGIANRSQQTQGSGFSSSQLRGASSGLNFFGDYSATITAGKMSVADASWKRFQAGRQSRLLLDNAKKRIAAGSKESGQIQYQGRVVESDAIAAMVAQGGTTDPVMLAKIKQTTDYNSLQALFSASADARSMRRQAFNVKSEGEMGYMRAKTQQKIDRYGATANLITGAMSTGMMMYGGGG